MEEDLLRAAELLFQRYPNSTIYCQITANCVLVSDHEFSLFYGQKFSPKAKQINLGAKFNAEGTEVDSGDTFILTSPGDAASLPTTFPADHFEDVFRLNFGSTRVRIHSVVSLIFKFSKTLDEFIIDRRTQGQRWISLF